MATICATHVDKVEEEEDERRERERTAALEKYKVKTDDFLRLTKSYQFIFEVTKCCGYTEWVTVFKAAPVSQLRKNLIFQWQGNAPGGLYAMNETGDRLEIPADEDKMNWFSFHWDNWKFFKPIYPLPAVVVYRLYYDEGICHLKKHQENQQVLCEGCILHK